MKKLIENINDMRKSLNEISVYDLNVYSAIELYYKLALKTNEVITELSRFEGVISDEIIEQNEKLTYLLGEGLNIEVGKKINQMVADGTMDTIINHNVFNSLNNKIEDYKDEDFDPDADKNCWNLVRIHTAQNGKWVDDTEDTYVTDGSLYRELERIWNYRDFATL